MASKKRTVQAPGKVDFDKLGVAPPENIRWRVLRNYKTRSVIRMYGYCVSASGLGPWVGYDETNLGQAPCTHCGFIAFEKWRFSSESTRLLHVCPGHFAGLDSSGNRVPCNFDGVTNDDGGHVCSGKPSMSWHGVKRWNVTDGWMEVTEAELAQPSDLIRERR